MESASPVPVLGYGRVESLDGTPKSSLMTYQELDYVFPFFVFGYGALMLLVLTNPKLTRLAEDRLPSEVWSQFKVKKAFALVCFVVGALWALQNIWLS